MAKQISRRNWLKGMGAAALSMGAFGAANGITRAQTTPLVEALASVYRFNLGDWEMAVIKDTAFTPPATIWGVNQDEETVVQLFEDAHVLNDDGTINALVDILVGRSGDNVVLFDTGFGPAGGGTLVPSLEALGIAPGDVTHVISSHFHPDHINGLSNEGTLTYPNAMVMFPQPEYDFLQNAPEDVSANAMGRLAPAMDADMVSFYSDEDEILPGVMAMHAPGHTPGQMNFLLENNGNRMMHMVDSVLNLYAHVPNPGWHAQFDADGPTAVETRTRIMGMAADESIPVFGYHFPFPGVFYLDRDGEGFRATPVAF